MEHLRVRSVYFYGERSGIYEERIDDDLILHEYGFEIELDKIKVEVITDEAGAIPGRM